MAVHTVNIDVVDPTSNNPIAVIGEPQPCENYAATAYEVRQLIQIAKYYIYEAGTKKTITAKNYYEYFPEEQPGGGGVTPEDVQNMITASIDTAVSSSSTNAIQNKVIKEYVDSGLNSKVDTSSLADVATTGSYNDLSNKPTIDSELSDSSTNAVQNKVITGTIGDINAVLEEVL